jgi:hypothetical protein
LKYTSEDWEFETEYPEWAKEGWSGDSDIKERFWDHGGKWDGKNAGEFLKD